MGEQLEFDFGGIERKDEIFYVRCRRKVKKALLLQMDRDGFSSMADWFEQFVVEKLGKKGGKSGRKKRKLSGNN